MRYRPNYSRFHKSLHAFTLVELLVVISIIALLLAILMPSLQKAREQTRKVICGSRLHQAALAIAVYFEDYGTAPLAWNLDTQIAWANILLERKRLTKENLVCPTVKIDPDRKCLSWHKTCYMGRNGIRRNERACAMVGRRVYDLLSILEMVFFGKICRYRACSCQFHPGC